MVTGRSISEHRPTTVHANTVEGRTLAAVAGPQEEKCVTGNDTPNALRGAPTSAIT